MTGGEAGVEAVVQADGEVASAAAAAVAAAEVMKHRLHGFDAFRGLPEDWEFTEASVQPRGSFALDHAPRPSIDLPRSVQIHEGWFNATVVPFEQSLPPEARVALVRRIVKQR